MSEIKYRREIDGLRAIAVLAVILYHAKITLHGHQLFPGGFLGVDIFFVISGYLITSILIKEIEAKTFSFAGFYERRARRILPALFFVMAVSIPFAWNYILPRALIEYAQSLISSIFFVSNIFFWQQDSYIAEPSLFKPFLHTWSLSVEEQYYIFFPILLILIWKFSKRNLQKFLVAGFVVSLVLSEWIGIAHRDASFFLFPMRAWELFAGALLCYWHPNKVTDQNKWTPKLLPGLGLILIAISVLCFNDHMQHLTLYMVVPVLGTMSVIHYGGHKDIASKIISLPIFVGIGLISYSLYLWHQPIFVFFRLAGQSSDVEKALIAISTFVLAFLTWKYIEQPFRNKTALSRKSIITILTVAAICLTGISIFILKIEGFPNRFPSIIVEASSGEDPLSILKDKEGACHNRKMDDICVLGNKSGHFDVVTLGDSHIASFSSVLWDRVKEKNGSYTGLTFSGHYAPELEINNNGIIETNSYERGVWTRDYLLKLPPSIILIGGRLPLYYSGDWFDNKEGGKEGQNPYFLQSKGGNKNDAERRAVVASTIKVSIQELLKHGHKVVLIYPVPEAGWHVPKQLVSNYYKHINNMDRKDHWLSTSYEVFKERSKDSYVIYDSVGQDPNLIRIYPEKIFCNTYIKDRCINNTDKDVYYVDGNHLSLKGSALLVDKIMSSINQKWHI